RQRPARQAGAERTRKHLRKQRENGGAPGCGHRSCIARRRSKINQAGIRVCSRYWLNLRSLAEMTRKGEGERADRKRGGGGRDRRHRGAEVIAEHAIEHRR